jgi:hypothetical protein
MSIAADMWKCELCNKCFVNSVVISQADQIEKFQAENAEARKAANDLAESAFVQEGKIKGRLRF